MILICLSVMYPSTWENYWFIPSSWRHCRARFSSFIRFFIHSCIHSFIQSPIHNFRKKKHRKLSVIATIIDVISCFMGQKYYVWQAMKEMCSLKNLKPLHSIQLFRFQFRVAKWLHDTCRFIELNKCPTEVKEIKCM